MGDPHIVAMAQTSRDLRVEVERLTTELEQARMVLVFADGLAVSNTGMCLADLYAEDYAPAQDALAAAGCWARGSFKASDTGGPTDG